MARAAGIAITQQRQNEIREIIRQKLEEARNENIITQEEINEITISFRYPRLGIVR